jgi:hypothetical protein
MGRKININIYPSSSALKKQETDAWREGRFELSVTHCTACKSHQVTAWHEESDFVRYFNTLGEMLLRVFPKITLLGNEVEP